MDVRPRTDEDLAWWPVDPAGWLSPSGCAAAWVAHDDVTGSILGHVIVVHKVEDPMVASLAGVGTDRLAGVSRLFVSPAARGLGLGLGASLLAAVSSWVSAHDLRLMLDAVDDGAPANHSARSPSTQAVTTNHAAHPEKDGPPNPWRFGRPECPETSHW